MNGKASSEGIGGIFIHQTKYIKDMLRKFEFEDCKPVSTPMTVGCKLSKQDKSKDVDQKSYRSMIGSLLYVTASRPDVKQVDGMVARFQSTPKENHVQAVKRIFRYLKETIKPWTMVSKQEILLLKSLLRC